MLQFSTALDVPVALADAVRVLVIGDKGVGKSSLVHLVCHGDVLRSASSTVGCSIEVSAHRYDDKNATFIEWMDIGGSQAFELSRKTWYGQFDAIVAVYDATNANSRNNLDVWLREVIGLTYLDVIPWAVRDAGQPLCLDLRLHPKKHLAGRLIPVIIVGTKCDLLVHKQTEFPGDLILSAHDPSLLHDVDFCARLNAFLDDAVVSGRAGTRLVSPDSTGQLRMGLGGVGTPFDTTTPRGRSPHGARTRATEVRLRIDFDDKKDD